jgi:crotonobetainyl-CoA:carnitine CoA-transferase CaiB-like acyl-CoA transferase
MGRILNLPALIEEVGTEVARYSTAEVLDRFARFDFAAGAVTSRRVVHEDPTVMHLGLISEHDTEALGRIRQPAPPWTFGEASTRSTTHIGTTGADSREVLAEFGLDDDEIDGLLADGTVVITEG